MSVRCVLLLLAFSAATAASSEAFSARLIHRFSSEARAAGVSSGGNRSGAWPEKRSVEYYHLLASSDLDRQKMKLGPKYQNLLPSEGSKTLPLGNDFGWLYYTWVDIGTPNVSFLVALDGGSDLLWVPCNCVQCAPLSSSYYSSLANDLNEYNPSVSSTSIYVSCSHQLCDSGGNCQGSEQQCPYTVNYYTENTSSSGLLVEDILHLAAGTGDRSDASAKARVVLGCGKKQSGGYLEGVAPDGLMGLGLGDISVPSIIAKAGLVRNSFSMCFDEEDSGRIHFGDVGPTSQQSTQFLPLNGKYVTYIVGVEACCIGDSCLKETSFRTLIDSGSSFTFLPKETYREVAEEFDRRMNAPSSSFEGVPWEYCYKSSAEPPNVPTIKLMFSQNNSFAIQNPVFMIYGRQGPVGFCLAIQSADEDIGTIGQNFMTGYRMVFDRESMKLGWSQSKCGDLKNDTGTPDSNAPPYSLPTNQQQSRPGGHPVTPAVAGRTPSRSSAPVIFSNPSLLKLLDLIIFWHAVLTYS